MVWRRPANGPTHTLNTQAGIGNDHAGADAPAGVHHSNQVSARRDKKRYSLTWVDTTGIQACRQSIHGVSESAPTDAATRAGQLRDCGPTGGALSGLV